MQNLARFLSFVFLSFGVSLTVVYGLRKLYHHVNLRSLLSRFEVVFDEAFQIMVTFRKHLLQGDRENARIFLVSELKRSPTQLPRRFRGFYDLLVRSAISEITRRGARLDENAEPFGQEVRETIRRTMIQNYEIRFNQESLRWVSMVVPIVAAASIFFPLVIYFYYDTFLRWAYPSLVVGIVLSAFSIFRIVREWR